MGSSYAVCFAVEMLPELKDRTDGELDVLFEHSVPARRFASTSVDTLTGSIEDADQKQKTKVVHIEKT
jgi:SP family general alpha glucoside:H+ symporter-like MFS transporter